MMIAQTIDDARRICISLGSLAFVPTMGALHEGHLSLIRRARQLCPRVAVSIFVNPAQFGPGEDFHRYPRPIERDLELCRKEGVDLVFQPSVEQIYPPQEPQAVIDIPSLTHILEGAHRPGHFSGVCRVVTKLLNILRPDVACFGMKDYQQWRVIQEMTDLMCLPVRIEPCPTLREADGLAMSSRNVYLDAEQRKHAAAISKALAEARRQIKQGETDPQTIEQSMHHILCAHHFTVDYATVRHPRTLQPVDSSQPPVVCLIAARLGSVRLIDNWLIE